MKEKFIGTKPLSLIYQADVQGIVWEYEPQGMPVREPSGTDALILERRGLGDNGGLHGKLLLAWGPQQLWGWPQRSCTSATWGAWRIVVPQPAWGGLEDCQHLGSQECHKPQWYCVTQPLNWKTFQHLKVIRSRILSQHSYWSRGQEAVWYATIRQWRLEVTSHSSWGVTLVTKKSICSSEWVFVGQCILWGSGRNSSAGSDADGEVIKIFIEAKWLFRAYSFPGKLPYSQEMENTEKTKEPHKDDQQGMNQEWRTEHEYIQTQLTRRTENI